MWPLDNAFDKFRSCGTYQSDGVGGNNGGNPDGNGGNPGGEKFGRKFGRSLNDRNQPKQAIEKW